MEHPTLGRALRGFDMRDLLTTETEIRWLQRRLNALGFDAGPNDGIRGPKTDAAIIAFKRSIGFYPRAYVGPLTKRALEKNAPQGATPWLEHARAIFGLHESRNVSALRKWFDKSVSWIDPRDVPWCGAFVATALRKWQPNIEIPDNPLGARNWSRFGVACQPQPGAIMTFWRGSRNGWQGHVGFYVGEDATHYHILGGNQSNAVTITRIAKTRFLHARFPEGVTADGTPVVALAGDLAVSTNEA